MRFTFSLKTPVTEPVWLYCSTDKLENKIIINDWRQGTMDRKNLL